MSGRREIAGSGQMTTSPWLARVAVGALYASLTSMVGLGLAGPRAGRSRFLPAPPWPSWFFHDGPTAVQWSVILWLVELLGVASLVLGLVAVRRGWRPRPRRLILGSVIAVIALMVIPPIDNGDPLYYAAYGRIAVLGHSPYVMTPVQLMPSADPIRAVVPFHQQDPPSRYGPVATGSEAAASELGGTSVARTLFWLKVWNALAYLAVVLAVDRVTRSDAARRVRAHLLWSVNPLMLFALLANGHNDVLAAAAGTTALFTLSKLNSRRGLLAGLLLGLATAIKAPYVLFGAGLAWAARRSPRTLATLTLGTLATLIPGYLLYGHDAITATTSGLASGEQPDLLWHQAALLLGWQHTPVTTNTVGLLGSVLLALILLWRMPPGRHDMPAIRVALALTLGLLIASPKQYASYDAMLFPLLAVFPASRLDWIAVARTAALAAASTPFLSRFDPAWLAAIEKTSIGESPTLVLGVVVAVLLWLCYTRAWKVASASGELLIESAPSGLGGTRAPTI